MTNVLHERVICGLGSVLHHAYSFIRSNEVTIDERLSDRKRKKLTLEV